MSDRSPAATAAATVGDLRRSAAGRLRAAGIESGPTDADWLLAHTLGVGRGELRDRVVPSADQRSRFETLLRRRCERVPLQHLTGLAGFRYLDLHVGPGVFVPRPETETLAELAIQCVARVRGAAAERAPGSVPRLRLVDLCTGSGAIAIALATELVGVDVWAVERSGEALSWARRNVASYREQIDRRQSSVRISQADVTDPAATEQMLAESGGFDLVVANPPYIPVGAVPCDPEVRDHDPAMALYGGTDGLDIVRAIVAASTRLLHPDGFLAIEHGDRQGEGGPDASVPQLLRDYGGFDHVVDHRDLAHRPRVTTARRAS